MIRKLDKRKAEDSNIIDGLLLDYDPDEAIGIIDHLFDTVDNWGGYDRIEYLIITKDNFDYYFLPIMNRYIKNWGDEVEERYKYLIEEYNDRLIIELAGI